MPGQAGRHHAGLGAASAQSASFNQALEPKKLVLIPGGHFDAYVSGFAVASTSARDWFVEHLQSDRT